MPAERVSRRKIKEVLRLQWECGLSNRQIAQSCALARPTVTDSLCRAAAAGVAWPLPADLDEGALAQLVFPPRAAGPAVRRPLPEWAAVHHELTRKGVTLWLLWQEYKAVHPQGYHYSWCCQHYPAWAAKVEVVRRQEHRAGEKLFVDSAGPTVPIHDPSSGEVRPAQVFVAVLGASSYPYAEASWTQSLPDWMGAPVRAFTFLGGGPELLVPDNLKSGVTQAHRYEPDLNPTSQEMAAHYGVAVLPTRARNPRDKAKVESGVLVVERWILARLRHSPFFSLAALNRATSSLVTALNQHPFKKLPGSRQHLCDPRERPTLKPWPAASYEYAEWKKVRVNSAYHVEVAGHYYSVPYQLVKQQVEVRLTGHCVECFYKGQRVSRHRRSPQKGRHTTLPEHMPKAHQRSLDWPPERLVRWAQQTGPATAQVGATILASRPHPQQGFRSCLGSMRLGNIYAPARLEAACEPALTLDACAYRRVQSLLEKGLDRQPLAPQHVSLPLPTHANIRGPEYYPSEILSLSDRRAALLNPPTLEKLYALRLTAMGKALEDQGRLPDCAALSFEERLGLLVDRELTERENRRLQARLRQAKLHQSAVLEDVDSRYPRGLEKPVLSQLATCPWIVNHHNRLITGPTGVGKTWLACALAHPACRAGHSAHYLPLPRLWRDLALAKSDGRSLKLLANLAKAELLVLDAFGLAPLTEEQRRALLEILDDRHGTRATLVPSPLPLDHWHEAIGDPTLAHAALDRLVHNAYTLTLKGDSMRKRTAQLTQPPTSD
jgi:transposase/DNA replication protein DnaC